MWWFVGEEVGRENAEVCQDLISFSERIGGDRVADGLRQETEIRELVRMFQYSLC